MEICHRSFMVRGHFKLEFDHYFVRFSEEIAKPEYSHPILGFCLIWRGRRDLNSRRNYFSALRQVFLIIFYLKQEISYLQILPCTM